MKTLFICLLGLVSFSAVSQTVKPKTVTKPVIVEHSFKEIKKTPFGFELSIVSGNVWNDDSVRTIEICFPDSTITFGKLLFPEYRTYKKGETIKNVFYVVGDSIAPKAKVAPVGTYKSLYPKSDSLIAEASIMFLIDIDSITGEQFMLPDVVVKSGQLAVGDTVSMIDNLGKKCEARVVYLDISNKELNSTIVVPFVHPGFYEESDQIRVVMYYTLISGDSGMHEKIQLTKL